jgi:hypothetical protein
MLKINDVLGLEIRFRMPEGVKMKEEGKDEEEEDPMDIGDFLNVEVKVEVGEEIILPETEEEEEMEPELEEEKKVKKEEEKKVKEEEVETMPTLDEEEIAAIKIHLDNKQIKNPADLSEFREYLRDLVGHRGGRAGGPHHWCLVCGKVMSTLQKARNHVEAKHVENTKHYCSKCHSEHKTSASLEHHKCKKK